MDALHAAAGTAPGAGLWSTRGHHQEYTVRRPLRVRDDRHHSSLTIMVPRGAADGFSNTIPADPRIAFISALSTAAGSIVAAAGAPDRGDAPRRLRLGPFSAPLAAPSRRLGAPR